jgi:tRNA pseudouridine-54 N-methylase
LSKGKPVSSTYLDLWCRTYDDAFIIANKEREMAFFSGFTGERAVRTWSSRMRILKDLGFIDIKEGPSGPISYVLIVSPYYVLRGHYEAGPVNEAFFNSLKQRMIEIGANDLDTSSAGKAKAK